MVLALEAVRTLQKKYPNKRIISGMDMTDFYAFQLWDHKVNPRSLLEFPVSPAMYAIRKRDGSEFLFHAFASQEGKYVGEIDVTPYLNKEDAAFVKKIHKLLENVNP